MLQIPGEAANGQGDLRRRHAPYPIPAAIGRLRQHRPGRCAAHEKSIWSMSETESEYLTTKELAQLLRIKERKVYDLAASGELP